MADNSSFLPGPTSGAGIARVLADPEQGNLAVALLARNKENLESLCNSLRQTSHGGVLYPFPCDTRPANLRRVFGEITAHDAFQGLPLELAIFHVKHALKAPYLETDPADFEKSVAEYATGAFAFGQEALRQFYAQAEGGQTVLSPSHPAKKGTVIFTGTLGALRTNEGFGAYGAGRSAVRAVAQALGKEHSRHGVHVVHTIANGPIKDVVAADGQQQQDDGIRAGKTMSAESVGRTYLWLSRMPPDLWVDELDMRPAQEKW
ncbi:hypothetical protein PFICI_03553 [Pestalotiopsis fici W106-1]|uniref:Oxidoreductase n=1 Tax=Pestalotiopsis fici (strain W106-1 / CGMCC3.15140) TaxID=1229662 RepID=W3XHH0_PESFW|nr:uncharacterized protein PFICI_03553 [Pestalotiopsis fici W106-1]ETS85528.1 hypothetical protein PFICI_03553 [Pestalotiopsis fici W106-1]